MENINRDLTLTYVDATNVKVMVGIPESVVSSPLIEKGHSFGTEEFKIVFIGSLYRSYAGGIRQATFCVKPLI